ncbi:hypothetical protein GCM10029978_066640 [Actinoallomurus acanthiterrae]
MSLQTQPRDLQTARALARTIADQAHCPDFEDEPTGEKNHWSFKCERSVEHSFGIETYTDPASADRVIKQLTALKEPFKSGKFFLVSEDIVAGPSKPPPGAPPGPPNPPSDLEAFPGDLTVPR